ncbi:glycosyl transferase, partial [Halorubrum tebenquichense DSM 14210]
MTASEPDSTATRSASSTATRSAPISVLLPTVSWTDACDEVAEQIRGPEAFGGDAAGDDVPDPDGAADAADELLVVCDSPDDPVADRRGDLPPRARIVIA